LVEKGKKAATFSTRAWPGREEENPHQHDCEDQYDAQADPQEMAGETSALSLPHLHGIYSEGNLMANYIVKYFNNIYDHAGQVAEVCGTHARLAYVIGNSKFYENPLPSDEILAAIFGHFGFELERIDRMRKRQSKTGLYEAIVFMKKN
jgi:hypothetical protein